MVPNLERRQVRAGMGSSYCDLQRAEYNADAPRRRIGRRKGGYTPPVFSKSAQVVCFEGTGSLQKTGVRRRNKKNRLRRRVFEILRVFEGGERYHRGVRRGRSRSMVAWNVYLVNSINQ